MDNKTGMTFWDFINFHKKFFGVLIIVGFAILITFLALLFSGALKIENNRLSLNLGNDKSQGSESLTLTHVVNMKDLAGGIGFRTDQSLDFSSYMGALQNGHKIQVLKTENNWYQIKTIFNCELKTGWISARFKSGQRVIDTVEDIDDIKLEILLNEL